MVFDALNKVYDAIEAGHGVGWNGSNLATAYVPRSIFGVIENREILTLPYFIYPWFDFDELRKVYVPGEDYSDSAERFLNGEILPHGEIYVMFTYHPQLRDATLELVNRDLRFLCIIHNMYMRRSVCAHYQRVVVPMRKMGRWIFTGKPKPMEFEMPMTIKNIERVFENVANVDIPWNTFKDSERLMGEMEMTRWNRERNKRRDVAMEDARVKSMMKQRDPILRFLFHECIFARVDFVQVLNKQSWDAFLLGTHPRLGTNSSISILCEDVLFLILNFI